MKTLPKMVKRKVGVLTNPTPMYVSIVDHGANQQPFTSVKHAGDQNMAIKRRKTAETATPGDLTVVCLTFDKAHFDSENAVNAYLSKHQWTGYDLEETEVAFVAKTDLTGVTFTDERDVAMATGVTGRVGKVQTQDATVVDGKIEDAANANSEQGKDDKEDNCDGTGACKGATPPARERVLRFDWYDAYYSGESTVSGVLEIGMKRDGTPPGMDDFFMSARAALGNVLSDENLSISDKLSKATSIGTELGTYVGKLYELCAGIVAMEETTDKSALAKSDNALAIVADVTDFVEKACKPKPKEDAKKEDEDEDDANLTPEQKAAKKKKPTGGAGATGDGPGSVNNEGCTTTTATKTESVQPSASNDAVMAALADVVAKGISQAVDPLRKSLDEISATLENVSTVAAEAKSLASKAEETAKATADRRQVQRSAPEAEPAQTTAPAVSAEKARKEAAAESLRTTLKSVLGC